MMSSVTCMDELKRANSAAVNCRNPIGLELLLTMPVSLLLHSNQRSVTATASREKEPPMRTGGLRVFIESFVQVLPLRESRPLLLTTQ